MTFKRAGDGSWIGYGEETQGDEGGQTEKPAEKPAGDKKEGAGAKK